MNPLVGALLLLLIGLAGARLSFTTRRAPLGPRLIFATGTHFLFIGFLLGSHGFGLITFDLVNDLYPFLALGLGWIGLLFGVQLDRRQIVRFPKGFLALAIVQAILTFALFAAGAYLLIELTGYDTPDTLRFLLLAAATACISTPAGIALIRHTYLITGKVSELLFFIASLDAIVGIIALQVVYGFYHPAGMRVAESRFLGVEWVLAAVAIAVALGVMFQWFARPKPERDDLMLFLLGLVVFAAGAALYLGLSPLFVCGVLGVLVANVSPLRRRVYAVLEGWEKPIYVVLLILAGALLSFPTWLLVPAAAAYFLIRAGSKAAAGWLARSAVRTSMPVPGGIGFGLVSQGGISLAMAISAALTYGLLQDPTSIGVQLLFSTVVLGVVTSELIGPFMSRGLLRRLGEIKPRVEAALAEGREPGAEEAFGREGRRAVRRSQRAVERSLRRQERDERGDSE